MKTLWISLSAGLSLAACSSPVLAQDEGEEFEELAAMGEMFGDVFGTAEPLTPEQEARLPAAKALVARLFPEGSYAKLMQESMGPMFDGVLGGAILGSKFELIALTGLGPSQLSEVDDDSIDKALSMLDPDAPKRNAAINAATAEYITDIMSSLEPSYRLGLERAYAVRFTTAEMVELEAMFSTPVGSKYAAESFVIFGDPQVMSSMNEMMPALMEGMPEMMGAITEVSSQFPAARKFSDLNSSEQAKLASLLGVTPAELAANEPEDEEVLIETIE